MHIDSMVTSRLEEVTLSSALGVIGSSRAIPSHTFAALSKSFHWLPEGALPPPRSVPLGWSDAAAPRSRRATEPLGKLRTGMAFLVCQSPEEAWALRPWRMGGGRPLRTRGVREEIQEKHPEERGLWVGGQRSGRCHGKS